VIVYSSRSPETQGTFPISSVLHERAPTGTAQIRVPHHWPRYKLIPVLGLIAALGLSAWPFRAPLLRSVADAWIVSDRSGPADAVAVFGGGIADRPFAAAEYYRAGLVNKVLVSNVRLGPAEQLGVVKPDGVANREVLLKLGVSAGDIEFFGDGLTSTHDEAVALHEWVERTGAHSIIVPTEIFAARRLRWMLKRVFGEGFTVKVPAIESPEYQRADWWQSEKALLAFQNEVIKYIYYRLKY